MWVVACIRACVRARINAIACLVSSPPPPRCSSRSLQINTHTRARTHAHARARTHTHTHTHTQFILEANEAVVREKDHFASAFVKIRESERALFEEKEALALELDRVKRDNERLSFELDGIRCTCMHVCVQAFVLCINASKGLVLELDALSFVSLYLAIYIQSRARSFSKTCSSQYAIRLPRYCAVLVCKSSK